MAAYPEVDAVVSFRLFMSLNSDEEHGGAAAEAAAPSTAPPAHRDRAAAVPRTPSMPRPALQDSPRRDPGGADEFLLSKVARSRVVIGGGDEDDDRNDGERLREYTVASVWSNSSCPELYILRLRSRKWQWSQTFRCKHCRKSERLSCRKRDGRDDMRHSSPGMR